MLPVHALLVVLTIYAVKPGLSQSPVYFGSRIGKFSTHFHDVKGDVYAIDDKSIFIKRFSYDGQGTDTFFWAGTSVRPDASGFLVPDERGSTQNLKVYHEQDIVLRLPPGKRLEDIRWLAVWSQKFQANFGSLIFPKGLQLPQPVVIGRLENTNHGISSGEILILDTQTLLVQDFSYDGTGQDASWWLSRGMKPNTGGLQLLDENHSTSPLRKYENENVMIVVPDDNSIFDYDTLSVWSNTDVTDYGMVKIPKDARVPPSSRSLGVDPENKLNCEMLNDNLGFEARWVIEEDQLIMQLKGNFDADEYMALGFSKDDTETKFTASDAVIVWISKSGEGHAVDYFLQSAEKCENGQGMCADTVHDGADDGITLLNAATVKGSTTVTFKRSLKGVDEQFDQNIYTDGPQAVLWAVGPIDENGEPGPPKLRTRGNLLLDFGREPMWNCPLTNEPADFSQEKSSNNQVEKVHCPNDLTFRAQLGPPRNAGEPKRVWYINGLPHPDLTIQRGQTYTFIVEGGDSPPSHHPLYITSSKDGGLYQKILEANEDGEAIYAGVTSDRVTGALLPTAEGRLCEWTATANNPEYEVSTSEVNVQSSLFLNCASGNAGILSWTPDANLSGEVFYQSFTHRNLGGRIRVVDFCEETDPDHYLQESQRKRGGNVINGHAREIPIKESEREKEDDDESEVIKSAESNIEEYSHPELQTESFSKNKNIANRDSTSPEKSDAKHKDQTEVKITETKTLDEHIMSNYGNSPRDISKLAATEMKKILDLVQNIPEESLERNPSNKGLSVTESTLDLQFTKIAPSVPSYPYDESERSDANILDFSNTEIAKLKIPRPVSPNNNPKESSFDNNNRNLHETEQKASGSPAGFNVQFEGGFVPLVLNSEKERETAIRPDYVPPPMHLRRPPRPFLFNESIPFHGTFKPGVPDFSGFNISHYTQDTGMIEPNHLIDHIALLSAPKPQMVQKPIPMTGHKLFRRPQSVIHRPQMLSFVPRPQMVHVPGQQKPLFYQITPKPQPNFPIPQPDENTDLEEVSSQRVQVSLQSANEKQLIKDIVPNIPIRQPNNGNRQHGFIPPSLIPPSPPIQRRPDVVEDDEVNFQPQQRPLHVSNNQNRKQPEIDKHFRPTHLRGTAPVRPPFKRMPAGGNNRLKNHGPPIPAPPPRVLSDAGSNKLPQMFIQRPPAPVPHQQENSKDNSFVYRLPNRPTVHLLKQPPQTSGNIMHHPRFPQPPAHALQIENSEKPSDKTSSEILDDSAASYEIMSSQADEENLPFLSPDNKPTQFQNNRPIPLGYFKRPQLHPNIYGIQDIRPYLTPDQLHINKPNKVNQLNIEQTNKQLLIKSHIAGSQQIPEDNDKDIRNIEPNQLSADSPHSSAGSNFILNQRENPFSDNNPEKVQIISIKKEESQEIHFPPLKLSNIPNVAKTEGGFVTFLVNSEKQQNPLSFSREKPNSQLPTKNKADSLEFLDEDSAINNPIVFRNVTSSKDKNQEERLQENIPFGARLKIRVSGDRGQLKPIPQVQPRPSPFPSRRQPQFSPPPTEVVKVAPATKKTDTLNKELTNLYFNPGSSNSRNIPPKEIKIKEISLPESEKTSSSTYPGRKNILPTDSKNTLISAPPKAPENIKLPEISEKPPTHDNGTDYSILSHVLSLIGGQPKQVNVLSPRNPHLLFN